MDLPMGGQRGVEQGESHAAAHVTQQIIEATGVADLLVGQSAHGGRRERNEDHAGSESANNDGPEERPWADGQVHGAEGEAAERKEKKNQADQPTIRSEKRRVG